MTTPINPKTARKKLDCIKQLREQNAKLKTDNYILRVRLSVQSVAYKFLWRVLTTTERN